MSGAKNEKINAANEMSGCHRGDIFASGRENQLL
jgi:hypothetical protein